MYIAVVTQTLKQYSKRKDKNLSLLMSIAEEFKITKILRGYMRSCCENIYSVKT
jgi:hypothetical protein